METDRPEVDGRAGDRFGDQDALVFPQLGYRRSYAEFENDVRECARALMPLGLGSSLAWSRTY
jgi:hypothetical protein